MPFRPPFAIPAAFAIGLFWMAYALIALYVFPHGPPMAEDTQSYIDYHPMRTPGYPVFLNALGMLAPLEHIVPPVQLAISAIAGFFLSLAVWRATRWGLFTAGLMAGIAANPYFTNHAFTIMTDSLFTSGVMATMACFFFFHPSRHLRWIVLAAIFTAILIAVRPVSYALLPLFFFWLWAYRRDLRPVLPRVLVAWILPLVVIVSLADGYHDARHGDTAHHSPILGITLFGKAAMMDRPAPEGAHYPELAAQIQGNMKTRHAVLADTKNYMDYLHWHADNEVFAQYTLLQKEIAQTAEENNVPRTDIMARTGLDYLRAYPLSYLKNVAVNWAGFWTVFTDENVKGPAGIAGMLALYILGLASAALAAWGFVAIKRKNFACPASGQDIRPLWITALFCHGYAVLTVLTCVEVTRYIAAIFPVLLLAGGLPCYALLRKAVARD